MAGKGNGNKKKTISASTVSKKLFALCLPFSFTEPEKGHSNTYTVFIPTKCILFPRNTFCSLKIIFCSLKITLRSYAITFRSLNSIFCSLNIIFRSYTLFFVVSEYHCIASGIFRSRALFF